MGFILINAGGDGLIGLCIAGNRTSVVCWSPGWFLNVHPADAHRGPDFSVPSEPDDGVPPTLQPLL